MLLHYNLLFCNPILFCSLNFWKYLLIILIVPTKNTCNFKFDLFWTPRACTLNFLIKHLLPYRNKLECLLLSVAITLVYYLQPRLGANHYNGTLQGALLWCAPALPANIILGWKWLTVECTLACYDTAKFMAIESITHDIFIL